MADDFVDGGADRFGEVTVIEGAWVSVALNCGLVNDAKEEHEKK